MKPETAAFLAQLISRESSLSAALSTIAGLPASLVSKAPELAKQAMRCSPPLAVPAGIAGQETDGQAVNDPSERLLACFTRLLIAAEAATEPSKTAPGEREKALAILGLAVVVATQEARDIFPVAGMDAISLAITLQRQNEAMRAHLVMVGNVLRAITPSKPDLVQKRARALRLLEGLLELESPLAAPVQDWGSARVVPFPKVVRGEE